MKTINKKELTKQLSNNITNLMNHIDVVDEDTMNDFSFLSILLLGVCKDIDNISTDDVNTYEFIMNKYLSK